MGEVNFASHPLSIYVLTFRLSCLAGCSRKGGGSEGWRSEGRKERVSVLSVFLYTVWPITDLCSFFFLGARTIARIPQHQGGPRNEWKGR